MSDSDLKPEVSQSEWRDHLAEIGRKEGFFEELGAEHSALFVKRGPVLVVSFENLDHVYENDENRMPWGYDFVVGRDWSMLGMMAHDWTWYRDPAVYAFFDRLARDGFFDQFEKVVFYGASMGGYGACAFSACVPGSIVIAISPQATLDRSIASWETRYRKAWRRDFSGPYSYGPEMVESAEIVHLFYDPLAPLDAMHGALFQGENIVKYSCRFMGHRIASLWLQIKILKKVGEGCVDGTLSEVGFYQMIRARRELPRYQRETLERLQARKRPGLVIRYCEAVLARRPAPRFRRAMNDARKELAAR